MGQLEQIVGMLARRQKAMEAQHQMVLDKYEELIRACESQPQSITKEIDALNGRRIFYNLAGTLDFTAAQNGLRAQPISYLISQDGAFIATHYPLVMWRPSAPTNADNLGAWSPVGSWPLPTQEVANLDIIDLSYEVVDTGSQRNFQNEAAGPVFSRPDNLIPLPVPTLFSPASTIQFFATFNRIFFNPDSDNPTTAGKLVVTFPGYRVVNM